MVIYFSSNKFKAFLISLCVSWCMTGYAEQQRPPLDLVVILSTNCKEILEVDEVKPENVLSGFEQWDSLSVLSVIVMADSDYGVTIYAKDIMKLATVEDLFLFIQNKQDNQRTS